MRTATLTLEANESFPVPISTGYSVYGALLAKLETIDNDVSQHIHDAEFASLHNSGLIGNNGNSSFGHSDKSYHKQIQPDEKYTLKLGVIDEDDIEIFDALARTFAFDDSPIELTHGDLYVTDFSSYITTYADLIDDAQNANASSLRMTFETPTGIKEAGEVTTAFPHRRSVFRSLLRRWNKTAPEDHTFNLTEEDIEAHLIEKPQYEGLNNDAYASASDNKKPLTTDSVVTKRIPNDDGSDYYRHLQGFLGTCDYQFKQADEELTTALTALAKFAEYAGIGSAVSRGCGTTTVEVNP